MVKSSFVDSLPHNDAVSLFGRINLCGEEATEQAVVVMHLNGGDVPRVMNVTLALTALNDGVFVEWVHMKRSEQKHRHIDRQQDPGKQLLPATDVPMCPLMLHALL
ncbi:MAG: hypothetical protein II609_05925 [Muribaculaceae bacterium]|nr:hypothetical protein [Muribaculaceae bacterium]